MSKEELEVIIDEAIEEAAEQAPLNGSINRKVLRRALTDAYDAYKQGDYQESLLRTRQAQDIIGSATAKSIVPISADHLLTTDPPPFDWLVKGFMERGDVFMLAAPSKSGKSFLANQLALCVATGTPFLEFEAEQPMKVLLIQTEIKAGHFHRRIKRQSKGLQVHESPALTNLRTLSLKGESFLVDQLVDAVHAAHKEEPLDLVVVDPLYTMFDGDENSAQDMRLPMLRFQSIAAETGAAVLFVHHEPKGLPGLRSLQDRGAGSAVVGRAIDGGLYLTDHANEESGCFVISSLMRNTKSIDDKTIRIDFDEGQIFTIDEATEASMKVTPGKKTKKLNDVYEDVRPTLLDMLEDITKSSRASINTTGIHAWLTKEHGCSARHCKQITNLLELEPGITLLPGMRNSKLYSYTRPVGYSEEFSDCDGDDWDMPF